MEKKVVTCVYCGHEYPQETPSLGNAALADHVLSVALDRELEPLPRPQIDELHRQRVAFVRRQGLRR